MQETPKIPMNEKIKHQTQFYRIVAALLAAAGLLLCVGCDHPARARQPGQDKEPATQSQKAENGVQSPESEPTAIGRAASNTPAPDLPRVLIIGDSISIGYTPFVKEMLEGTADVHRIPNNGGHTQKGLDMLTEWLGDEKWDLIHFNWGLHDLRLIEENGVADARRRNTPREYGQNLEQLVERLQATNATLIFATTTPVPEGAEHRNAGDEVEYNRVALDVMHRRGIPVNDLCGYIRPHLAEYQLPANVHFTPEGSEYLARRVADEIRKALHKQSPPDDRARQAAN